MKRMNFEKRLALLKEQFGDEQCWPWPGYVDPITGYASAYWKTVNGKQIKNLVHRMAYLITKGEIPAGLVIDHVCRNRICINPAHLEAVTQLVNFHRSNHPKRLLHTANICANGHDLNDNPIIVNGSRRCRICCNEWMRNYRRDHAEQFREYEARRTR